MRDSRIYITPYKKGFKWKNAQLINFENYTITETDYRAKTAKFNSPEKIPLDTGNYAVMIQSNVHENFSGIILSTSDKSDKEIYEYQCQDWNRLYMDKLDLNISGKVYDILKKIITKSGGSTSGLKKISKYEQGKYGSVVKTNPMKLQRSISLKHNKTSIEAIKSLVYNQRPYIDIHYDNQGTILFTPYYKDEWMYPVCNVSNVLDYEVKLDTTNILTNVSGYGFKKLFNSKKDYLSSFINVYSGVDDPSDKTNNSDNTNSTDKTNSKTSKSNNKTGNVYNTKNKEVWIVMDRCWGGSTDSTYMNKFANQLTKLGWKVHKGGIGPGNVIPGRLPSDMKNGVRLIIGNGADCEVFRHIGHDKWFKGQLLKKNCRSALILIADAGDIRKGGRYYKHLGMAHDGTGKGSPGLKYPAGYLAACGVPFGYSFGNNPVKAAKLFNNGGESQVALNTDYKKQLRGYYANWNWSSKY